MTQITVGRAPLVGAPTPAPHTGNLLDVADVHEGLAWLAPQDMFTSWNCIDANSVELCTTDPSPQQKTFESPSLVDGVRFAVYVGGACKPLSADVESDINRVFDLRESRAVEKVFEQMVLGSGEPLGQAVTGAAHALGEMENALGDAYAGIGTIHISPLVATTLFATQSLVERGGRYYTRLGTKVVVGTGYTSNAMYGTGEVTIYRGPKVLVPAPDTANNIQNVLAERAYIVNPDCVVLVSSEIPPPGPI